MEKVKIAEKFYCEKCGEEMDEDCDLCEDCSFENEKNGGRRMKYNYDFPDSAMLESCEYNSTDSELEVRFKNGRSYTYVDVDKDIYDGLVNAPSAGRQFNLIKKDLKQK